MVAEAAGGWTMGFSRTATKAVIGLQGLKGDHSSKEVDRSVAKLAMQQQSLEGEHSEAGEKVLSCWPPLYCRDCLWGFRTGRPL